MIEAAGNVCNDRLVETVAALFGYNLDGTKKENPGGKAIMLRIYTPRNIYREIQYRTFSRRG